MRLNSLLKKCFLGAAVPQRLEAAVDCAAVAARVELVPFPFVLESRAFQQSVKPHPFNNDSSYAANLWDSALAVFE